MPLNKTRLIKGNPDNNLQLYTEQNQDIWNLTQCNGKISATLNVTITAKRDILRKNADPLNDNENQYLKERRYRKASVKQLV